MIVIISFVPMCLPLQRLAFHLNMASLPDLKIPHGPKIIITFLFPSCPNSSDTFGVFTSIFVSISRIISSGSSAISSSCCCTDCKMTSLGSSFFSSSFTLIKTSSPLCTLSAVSPEVEER